MKNFIGKVSCKLREISNTDQKRVPLEPAQWINKISAQIWPYMTSYFEAQLKNEVERVFKTFKVTVVKVSLGDKVCQSLYIVDFC